MLSDPEFGEEFDTIVDEIADEYLKNELAGDERERIQTYFLSSTERQSKLEFAAELLRRAERQGKKLPRPSLLEQFTALLRQPSFAPIAVMAAVVIVAGLAFFKMRSDRSENYVTFNIAISTNERATGPTVARVKPGPNTGLKLTLTVPENAKGAKDYVARLAGGNGTDLEIDQRTEQAVTVIIPAGSLNPGTYAVQLFVVKPDNTTQRIPGSYYFAVE